MTTSSLRYLVTGVTNWFASYVPAQGTSVFYGWRQGSEQINEGTGGGNRVGFALGDSSGNLGRLTSPTKNANGANSPVGNPRIHASWEKVLTCFVWAYDSTNPTDDLLQFDALETLLEQTVTAVRTVIKADALPTANVKTNPFVERGYGIEISFQLQVSSPLFGLQRDLFPADNQVATPVIEKGFTT